MGKVERNRVEDARGVGIFCGDYSHCEIADNSVSRMRRDETSADGMRAGYAIQAHFWAHAEVEDNRLEENAHDHGAFAGGRTRRADQVSLPRAADDHAHAPPPLEGS